MKSEVIITEIKRNAAQLDDDKATNENNEHKNLKYTVRRITVESYETPIFPNSNLQTLKLKTEEKQC